MNDSLVVSSQSGIELTREQLMLIEVGQVVQAYRTRNWMRSKIPSAQAEAKEANRNLQKFGMFEDCGASYEHCAQSAQTELNTTTRFKVKLDRNFKKLRYALAEHYPEALPLLAAIEPGAVEGFKVGGA